VEADTKINALALYRKLIEEAGKAEDRSGSNQLHKGRYLGYSGAARIVRDFAHLEESQ